MSVFGCLFSSSTFLSLLISPILLLLRKLDFWSIIGCHADATDASNWLLPIESSVYVMKIYPIYDHQGWDTTTRLIRLICFTEFSSTAARFGHRTSQNCAIDRIAHESKKKSKDHGSTKHLPVFWCFPQSEFLVNTTSASSETGLVLTNIFHEY